jgi:hypothetical protein
LIFPYPKKRQNDRSALNGSVPENTFVSGDKAVGRASARQRRRVKTRPTKHLNVHQELLMFGVRCSFFHF